MNPSLFLNSVLCKDLGPLNNPWLFLNSVLGKDLGIFINPWLFLNSVLGKDLGILINLAVLMNFPNELSRQIVGVNGVHRSVLYDPDGLSALADDKLGGLLRL